MPSLLPDPLHSVESASPRVLVADDDPASSRFLGDGMRSLGAQVDICTHGGTALERARSDEGDAIAFVTLFEHGVVRSVRAEHVLDGPVAGRRQDVDAQGRRRSEPLAIVASRGEQVRNFRQELLRCALYAGPVNEDSRSRTEVPPCKI